MHTDCENRSLAPAVLGIPLQMQRDASRNSDRLNCYAKAAYIGEKT
ncbi:hypothetical protein RUMHYD_01564 [Blautia hydrogenotrophica DSM 10507]|uniref:Uncharacterized protein n=1 Tax=Blautia hydrogenotrophica (strain DSM 10507 / JCM 14656 / S5a33) TaxID=476272 RepID=C0CL43_BLAHS|nr:hypothetical protein RUMHYD_01564 [Blautia hydrogenotrophica DSM 10507]